jgi:hypothetical protein
MRELLLGQIQDDHGYASLTETDLPDFPNRTNVGNDSQVTTVPTALKSWINKGVKQ